MKYLDVSKLNEALTLLNEQLGWRDVSDRI